MKIYYLLIFTILSCKFTPQNLSNCFANKGIKTAIIEATLLSDKTQTVSGTIYFNESGQPILREYIDRKIELKYELKNLTHTIINQHDQIAGSSKINTNVVAKNDELGRPLKIIGEDGGMTEYIYQNCDEQIETYTGSDGKLIQKFKSIFKDGLLVETVWIPNDNTEERKTKYFNYKLDDRGYWIERTYKYANGDVIRESRKLEYY